MSRAPELRTGGALGNSLRFAAALALLLASGPTAAYERFEHACVRFVASRQAYKTEVRVYSGQELNEQTGTLDHNPYFWYGLIVWGPDETTLVTFDYLADGKLTPYENRAVDRQGYPWDIVADDRYCF